MKDSSHCRGCRNDYYNGQGASVCWLLKSARLKKKWRIGWWTSPLQSGAFQEVIVPSCYTAPGKDGYSDKLPDFAVNPRRLKRAK